MKAENIMDALRHHLSVVARATRQLDVGQTEAAQTAAKSIEAIPLLWKELMDKLSIVDKPTVHDLRKVLRKQKARDFLDLAVRQLEKTGSSLILEEVTWTVLVRKLNSLDATPNTINHIYEKYSKLVD